MSIVRNHRGLIAGSVIAGAALAVGIGGAGYAATGGNFILGGSNSASQVSKLTNANGTALSLVAKTGTPALQVNTPTKVANLNADMVDGLSSSSFQKAGTVVRASAATYTPSEGPINRQARAFCNTGEHAVGGGADVRALTDDRLGEYYTFVNISAPINSAGEPTSVAGGVATGWKVEATNTANHMSGLSGRDSELYAFVVCAPN
jgi:hypothetical protein